MCTLHELGQSPASLRALERVTRQPERALDPIQRKVLRAAVDDGYEDRLVEGAYEWPQHARGRRLQAVCPACLDEAGYAMACWDYVQAPVCLQHRVRLIDHCDACRTPIKLDRTKLLTCEACGHSLGRAKVTPVDDLTLEAARCAQAARTMGFGTPDSNLPIEPDDLSGLLRLLLLPRLGQSVTWGLTGDLEAVDVERRLDALRRLGHALDGTRVDSGRLRAEALNRWAYAPLLPEHQRVRLLREACETVALPPDVTAMLCWDRETSPLPTAVELFEPDALPRLMDLRQLGQRLGLSREDLRTLMAEEAVSEIKPEYYGFDMDEVLRLERAVAQTLTLDEADRMLGWPGLAAELVSMRLVVGVTRASGEMALHPRGVTRLFEDLQERMTVLQVGTPATVSLATVARAWGLDARQVSSSTANHAAGLSHCACSRTMSDLFKRQ